MGEEREIFSRALSFAQGPVRGEAEIEGQRGNAIVPDLGPPFDFHKPSRSIRMWIGPSDLKLIRSDAIIIYHMNYAYTLL